MSAAEKDARCTSSGGVGIGAGHTCRCSRPASHPLDSERPHGCPCGAPWWSPNDCKWCWEMGYDCRPKWESGAFVSCPDEECATCDYATADERVEVRNPSAVTEDER